ncbi:hypothetical protein I4U23_001169 [Adineta vaga]|nr:hypothetical protein I4U23_001169 [Adineta vaga]
MVEEALSNFGLFIDNENKIRLIDPEKVTDSAELRDECKDFIDNVLEFKKIVDTLIEKTEQYSKQVEAARLRSIGAKNMLKSASKYREFEKQQLQSLIKEKMIELDRLRTEYESLQKTEREQNEKMEQLSLKSYMNLFVTSVILLLITVVQEQINADIGRCACDLNKGTCDVSCCCDTDCSTNDLQAYRCDVKLESVIKTTCFKDLSLYRSNSPYIIRKENGLTCIDQERSVNYTYYQQLIDDKMNSSVFTRSVNTDNSVSLSTSTPINLTQYQVGTSVFRYFRTNNVTSTFSLPISFPNGPLCSSTKTITYLNDFTSTCTQSVNQQTCTNVLNPVNYASDFCLITNPTTLTDSNPTPVCCSATVTASNWVSGVSTCAGALQTLNLIIYYTNPNGIVSCNITWTSNSPTSTSQQTFTVSFIRNGSVSSTVPRSGNPGYLQGAAILVIYLIYIYSVSQFTIPQALSTGLCSTTSTTTIRFGQNIQSTCLFG